MASKIKPRAKKPSLSVADKLIYYFLYFLAFILPLLYFYCISFIAEKVAYYDVDVIAFNNGFIYLTSLPLILLLTCSAIVIATMGLKNKQPIFGNKNYKAKYNEYTIKVYPVFSDEFKNIYIKKNKKQVKTIAKIFLSVLFVFLLILPFGICSREVITKDNQFFTVNSFNRISHSCAVEDFDKLVINVNMSGKNRNYVIDLDFISSDKTYTFSPDNFSEMSMEDALIYMLKLKSIFKDNEYEIKNADRLHFLMLQNDYTNNEKALIYELFDQ